MNRADSLESMTLVHPTFELFGVPFELRFGPFGCSNSQLGEGYAPEDGGLKQPVVCIL